MGRYKARIVDKNRFTKKYPFVRAPKRLAFLGTSDLALELGKLTFNNETSKTFTFEVPFEDSNYNIVAIPRDTTSADSAQVNIFIDRDGTDASKVKVDATAPFTGVVDIMAIRIS